MVAHLCDLKEPVADLEDAEENESEELVSNENNLISEPPPAGLFQIYQVL